MRAVCSTLPVSCSKVVCNTRAGVFSTEQVWGSAKDPDELKAMKAATGGAGPDEVTVREQCGKPTDPVIPWPPATLLSLAVLRGCRQALPPLPPHASPFLLHAFPWMTSASNMFLFYLSTGCLPRIPSLHR